jgi:hypothetical protein
MTAPDTKPAPKGAHIEQALRLALSGSHKQDITDAMGWDQPFVSRFLAGTAGVTIDKIDTLVSAAGFVLVSTRYLNAVTTLCEVGAHCECARQGRGECGPNR